MTAKYRDLPPLVDPVLVYRAMTLGTDVLCDGLNSLSIERYGCMHVAEKKRGATAGYTRKRKECLPLLTRTPLAVTDMLKK